MSTTAEPAPIPAPGSLRSIRVTHHTMETQQPQSPPARPRSKSRTIMRMLTTKFTSPPTPRRTATLPTRKPQPSASAAAPNAHAQERRMAALRERGLLPPLPARDLSAQERDQDARIPVVSDAEGGMDETSAADLIKRQWEARNAALAEEAGATVENEAEAQPAQDEKEGDAERMRGFRFGGGSRPSSPGPTTDTEPQPPSPTQSRPLPTPPQQHLSPTIAPLVPRPTLPPPPTPPPTTALPLPPASPVLTAPPSPVSPPPAYSLPAIPALPSQPPPRPPIPSRVRAIHPDLQTFTFPLPPSPAPSARVSPVGSGAGSSPNVSLRSARSAQDLRGTGAVTMTPDGLLSISPKSSGLLQRSASSASTPPSISLTPPAGKKSHERQDSGVQLAPSLSHSAGKTRNQSGSGSRRSGSGSEAEFGNWLGIEEEVLDGKEEVKEKEDTAIEQEKAEPLSISVSVVRDHSDAPAKIEIESDALDAPPAASLSHPSSLPPPATSTSGSTPIPIPAPASTSSTSTPPSPRPLPIPKGRLGALSVQTSSALGVVDGGGDAIPAQPVQEEEEQEPVQLGVVLEEREAEDALDGGEEEGQTVRLVQPRPHSAEADTDAEELEVAHEELTQYASYVPTYVYDIDPSSPTSPTTANVYAPLPAGAQPPLSPGLASTRSVSTNSTGGGSGGAGDRKSTFSHVGSAHTGRSRSSASSCVLAAAGSGFGMGGAGGVGAGMGLMLPGTSEGEEEPRTPMILVSSPSGVGVGSEQVVEGTSESETQMPATAFDSATTVIPMPTATNATTTMPGTGTTTITSETTTTTTSETSPKTPLTPPASPRAKSSIPKPKRAAAGAPERKKSLNPFKRSASTPVSAPDTEESPNTNTNINANGTGMGLGRRLSVAASFSHLRRSVVGTISSSSLQAQGKGQGQGGQGQTPTKSFDASHLPPSPTLPAAFSSSPNSTSTPTARPNGGSTSPRTPKFFSQQQQPPAVQQRQAVAPVVYSPGTILAQANAIEDEETRRMTELAFLG